MSAEATRARRRVAAPAPAAAPVAVSGERRRRLVRRPGRTVPAPPPARSQATAAPASGVPHAASSGPRGGGPVPPVTGVVLPAPRVPDAVPTAPGAAHPAPRRPRPPAPVAAVPVAAAPAPAVAAASRPETSPGGRSPARRMLAPLTSRAVRTHGGTAAGVLILGVLMWRMGTGPLLDGLRRIDLPALLAALGIGVVTTVFSAWRWALVARGLRIRLPLGPAVADYYRALFLNAALPGGVLGDVHRAVRHGRSEGDVGRGVRAVVLERAAGQLALAAVGVTVLLVAPSPVRADVRHAVPLAALGTVGAVAVALALRMNRPLSAAARRGGRARALLVEARESLLSRRNGPGVALSSLVVLAGHIAMFVVAARVAGSAASAATLLPLAVLALLAMSLPLNVGGWGPREGVTVWAFGAAGLGADTGLAVAVVYGVLGCVAALPGAVVLVVRRNRAGAGAADSGPAPGPDERYPRSPPAASGFPDVSSEKYDAKESARLTSSSFPFSADPREGRPMTPESV